MIGIIKALDTYPFIFINSSGFKVLYRCIHMIIIIRIVLEGIDFVSESVFERLSEIHVRLVRIERAIGIGGI